MTISEKTVLDATSDRHIICFIALPFGDKDTFRYESILLPALRRVLEAKPYYWQVSCAADKLFGRSIHDNVGEWLKRADAYIADISDLNHNVMMEFGYMLWAKRPDQPLVILDRTGARQQLADAQGLLCVSYTLEDYQSSHDGQIEYARSRLAQSLRLSFGGIPAMQALNQEPRQHFLSALWIKEKCSINLDMADAVSKEYTTMEAIELASESEIADTVSNDDLRLSLPSAKSIRDTVVDELKQIRKRSSH